MGKLDKSGKEYLNKLFSQILVSLLVFFCSAGTIFVVQGWVYFIVDFAWTAAAAIIVVRKNPEVLNRRNVPFMHNTPRWDKVLLFLYLAIDSFVLPIVAGSELGRRESSGLDPALFVPGFLLYGFATALAISAMVRNDYFEITARLQDDRDQTVITGGPYRFVRHPGYLSFILNELSIPLLLDSRYAWICAAAVTVIIALRTAFEDSMLRKGLPGYTKYAETVRYRLIPLVW